MKIKKFNNITENVDEKKSMFNDKSKDFLRNIDNLESEIREEIYNLMIYFEMIEVKFNEYDDTISIINNKDEPFQENITSIIFDKLDEEIYLKYSSSGEGILDDVWRINDLYNIYTGLLGKIDESFVYQEELIRTNNIKAILLINKKGYLNKRILKKYPHIFTGNELNLL